MLSLESKNCSTMAKSAGGGGGGHEIELELELGLSIGRSYNKKSKPESNDTTYNGVVSSFMGCLDVDNDPLRLSEKSEIQELRRQEAKKKRDARRQVKRSNLIVQPKSKKPKRGDCSGSDQDQVVNVKSVNQSLGFAAQYHPYPCANGGVVIPCWMTGVAGAGPGSKERNVIQPVARYGSCPLQVLSDAGFNLGRGYESERNGGNRIAVGSNGSSMCNSSAGSDCRSTSYEGGGSCDTRSHSSHTTRLPEDANAHLRHGATSLLKESTNNPEKVILSNTTAQSNPISPIEDLAKSATEKMLSDSSDHKHPSADESPSSSGPSKDCTAKPPKPQEQNQNSNQLSYMPCVSTTGNGPNGRTINGFLYRYTKAEVSIVCICHGTSFSPAEFVLHAGGTDVSHPLRHITVIPSVI